LGGAQGFIVKLDAMGTHRPYRPPVGIEAALGEISKRRGVFYDESAVNACIRLFRTQGKRKEPVGQPELPLAGRVPSAYDIDTKVMAIQGSG